MYVSKLYKAVSCIFDAGLQDGTLFMVFGRNLFGGVDKIYASHTHTTDTSDQYNSDTLQEVGYTVHECPMFIVLSTASFVRICSRHKEVFEGGRTQREQSNIGSTPVNT